MTFCLNIFNKYIIKQLRMLSRSEGIHPKSMCTHTKKAMEEELPLVITSLCVPVYHSLVLCPLNNTITMLKYLLNWELK